MDEFVTDRAPRPAATEHGLVSIEILSAHPAEAGLNWKRHRLPITASFSNTHGRQYNGAIKGNTRCGCKASEIDSSRPMRTG